MKIFFDIETVPLPDAELRAMIPEFDPAEVKMGNIKDPQKILEKLAQAKTSHEEEFFEKAALSARSGRVAAIGVMFDDKFEYNDGDESGLIESFWNLAREAIGTADQMVGFNILEFDLPFLVRRSWKKKIRIPNMALYGRRYDQWHDIFVDLRKVWLMGERSPEKGTSSLEGVAKYFGFDQKKGNGADFYKMTDEEKRAYSEQDVRLVRKIWERMLG